MTPLSRELAGRTFALLKTRPAAFAGLLVVGCAGLTGLPLFDVPGYELASAVTLVLAISTAILAATAVRQERRWLAEPAQRPDGLVPPTTPGRALLLPLASAWLLAFALALFPFLVSVLAALFGSRCSPWSGALFFVLLPLPTLLLAGALGALCALATRRRLGATGLFAALALVSLVVSLWPLWAGPQVFALNHLFGYFPGPLYDEALAVDARLLAFRALTLVWTLALVLLGLAVVEPSSLTLRRPRPSLGAVAAGVPVVVALVLFWAWDFELGLICRETDLARALDGRSETAHFVLHFPRTKPKEDVQRLERDLEFKYAQVKEFLGAAPEGKLHAWFHKSAEDKHRLVGAAQTNFAKPWRLEFHVQDEEFPHPVSRHEMAHAMAAVFGSPLFRVSAQYVVLVNVGFVEGLATAADNRSDELTLHQWAAAMRKLKLASRIQDIVGPTGFYKTAQSRAYTLAGSFLRFLRDRYGDAKLRAVYPSGDFEAAYGQSLDALAAEWEAFLDAVPLDARALHAAEVRFERPSIFGRPCAREVALAREEADKLVRADPEKALALYRRCAELDPGNPAFLRAQADVLKQRKDFGAAQAAWQEVLERFGEKSAATRAQALMALGDLAWDAGDAEGARAKFAEVLALHRDRQTDRTAAVKLSAVGTSAGDALRRYFAKSPDVPEVLALAEIAKGAPDEGAVRYLVGRNLFNHDDHAGAARWLRESLAAGLENPEVKREALRLLAQAAYLAGDCAESRGALTRLLEQADESDKAFAAEWRARCDFEEQAFGGPLRPQQ